MKPTTSHRSRSTAHRGAVLATGVVLSLSALLAGCSAGETSGSTDGSVQDAVGGDPAGPVEAAPPADVGTDSGTDATATNVDDGRQVIQTGDIAMTVDEPQDAAQAIVTLTDEQGGRTDSRTEKAATEDSVATAELTIRIPSTSVNGIVVELRKLGTVDTIELGTEDVTSAAEDLDARIAGLELSVARMSDLLSKAQSNAEIVQAEAALTERQTELEQLKSQRARLAEQVSLSTLTISLHGPAVAPPPVEEEVVAEPGPDSFLDGLSAGWGSFVEVLGGIAIVLGVLLPWLVAGGLITWGAVVLYRRYQRRHPQPEPGPIEHERIPVGVGAGQPPQAPPAHNPYE